MAKPDPAVPQCQTCPFWDQTTVRIEEPDADGNDVISAECHRSAPTIRLHAEDALLWHWPRTLATDWCGDHPDAAAFIAKGGYSRTPPP
jgi:hypothetical protein